MVPNTKRGHDERATLIIQTVTQPLIELLTLRGADCRQRQDIPTSASFKRGRPILRACAGCAGSGPMNLKQLKDIFSAAQAFTIRGARQLVVTLILLAAALLPPTLLAGELYLQEWQPLTQRVTLQVEPLEPGGYSAPTPRFQPLEPDSLLEIDNEAKIQAQTEYLAAKYRRSESTIREYVELAWKEASKRDGMSPELLIAMMQKESSLRPKVQSRYGAQGLMQVVRRWHPDKLHPSESLFDPEVNIRVGADVLEEYLEKAGGSLNKALGKYSGNARGYATRVLDESYKLARVAAEAAGQVLASKG